MELYAKSGPRRMNKLPLTAVIVTDEGAGVVMVLLLNGTIDGTGLIRTSGAEVLKVGDPISDDWVVIDIGVAVIRTFLDTLQA
jgi:hypothetical protein